MEIYTVRPGDSPDSVARRFGRKTEELLHANQLADPRRLTKGLPLVLPGPGEAPGRALEISAVLDPSAPAGVLAELLPGLSFVCPFCRRVGAEGLLAEPGDGRILAMAAESGALPLLTVANLNEAGGYDAGSAHKALGSESAREALLESLLAAVEQGYAGVYLSFCGLYPFDRDNYSAFLAQAAPALHERGRYLITAAAPREEGREELFSAAHDYRAHGQYADRVTLLAYDWGHVSGPPQAVSPLDRVRRLLDYAAGELPLGKVWLAFPMSGYDWYLPWHIGDRASPIANARAANLAVAAGAEVKQDALSRGSWFLYTDPDSRRHVIWYDGPGSVAARLRLVEEYGLAGISLVAGARLWRPALCLLQSRFSPEKLL